MAISLRQMSISLACSLFAVSETCYRYQPVLIRENIGIANWLMGLTHNPRYSGFGLCYSYLRNVKGFDWSHKRVYRIYRKLE